MRGRATCWLMLLLGCTVLCAQATSHGPSSPSLESSSSSSSEPTSIDSESLENPDSDVLPEIPPELRANIYAYMQNLRSVRRSSKQEAKLVEHAMQLRTDEWMQSMYLDPYNAILRLLALMKENPFRSVSSQQFRYLLEKFGPSLNDDQLNRLYVSSRAVVEVRNLLQVLFRDRINCEAILLSSDRHAFISTLESFRWKVNNAVKQYQSWIEHQESDSQVGDGLPRFFDFTAHESLLIDEPCLLDTRLRVTGTPTGNIRNFVRVYPATAISRMAIPPLIQELLKLGANVNSRDSINRTPLHHAAQSGFLDATSLLLENGAHGNAKDAYQYTPLHLAALHGKADVVRVLLQNGADIDAVESSFQTPLHLAVENDHYEVFIELLNYGANPNARRSDGLTPLHLAAHYHKHNWSEEQLKAWLERLLCKGADPNAKDPQNLTPLHYVCHLGRPEAVRLLLQFDADVDAKDENDKTPLHIASYRGNVEAVRLLLQKGAGVDAVCSGGRTPLQVAVQYNNKETIERLQEAANQPDMSDKSE
jgi:ankyrin repeat protein